MIITILGLDISIRSTGYCILKGDNFNSGVISPELIDDFRRKREVAGRINNEIIERLPSTTVVFIEGYSFGSQHRGQSIAELTGIIKHYLNQSLLKTYIVPPTVLKKFMTGKGNSDKNIMLLKIYKKYGKEFTNDDEADAFALAKLGEELIKNQDHELWKKVELLC